MTSLRSRDRLFLLGLLDRVGVDLDGCRELLGLLLRVATSLVRRHRLLRPTARRRPPSQRPGFFFDSFSFGLVSLQPGGLRGGGRTWRTSWWAFGDVSFGEIRCANARLVSPERARSQTASVGVVEGAASSIGASASSTFTPFLLQPFRLLARALVRPHEKSRAAGRCDASLFLDPAQLQPSSEGLQGLGDCRHPRK